MSPNNKNANLSLLFKETTLKLTSSPIYQTPHNIYQTDDHHKAQMILLIKCNKFKQEREESVELCIINSFQPAK